MSNNEKYKQRKEVLTSFFSNKDYKNDMTPKQVATLLGVPKAQKDIFNKIIEQLENENVILLDRLDNKVKYIGNLSEEYLVGTYEARTKKTGSVYTLKDEFAIPDGKTNGAMDKDKVLIKVSSKTSKKREAEIIKILKRGKTRVVGRFIKNNNFGFVEPIDLKSDDIFIPKKYSKNYKNLDMVEVEITKFKTSNMSHEGKILRRIDGKKGDDKVYANALYKSYMLDELDQFNEDVERELLNIPDRVYQRELDSREDKTDLKIVTIDSQDTKDIDDACFVKKLDKSHYLLSVYIADVSYYVKSMSAIDKEAIKRGTSIYIMDSVIPMLPKKLSNGICSLNEGVKRLAIGVDIIIDENGDVVNSNIYKAVIKVSKKMTYEKVYKVLTRSDEDVLKEYEDYIDDLDTMYQLSKILYKKRKNMGSIDFDIKETKVFLDKNGNVENIAPHNITDANKIIEEFMLITNMVIAEQFYFMELPFIYRIHEKPDDEKLRALNEVLGNYSKSIKSLNNVHPKTLSMILDSIEDAEEKQVVSSAMLRTLRLAKYSSECLGHFGLAARYYTHFTSPIRRYPDLFIHRVISDYLEKNGALTTSKLNKYAKQAYEYSFSSSEAERRANKIERDFVNLYEAIYMKKFIGQEFDAVVSGITSFGMFVKLENTVEGFVAFDCMPNNDYYIYDENKNILIGKNTSVTFKISTKVRVKLIRVDVMSRQIDFKII